MRLAAGGLASRCCRILDQRFAKVYGARVLALVGVGDNGGDTLYAGAAMAARGAAVTAVLLDNARVHEGGALALRHAGGRLVDATEFDPGRFGGAEMVLDGIVGIGGRGGLRPAAERLVRGIATLRAADGVRPVVVAVDVPSGVEVDTGALPGPAVSADVTVTFGALKPCLVVGPAAANAGLVDLVDIGLGPHLRGAPALRVPDGRDVAALLPVPDAADDKYTRGVVGVVAGSQPYQGAAVLAVGGAVAGPAGMVRYAGPAADAVRRSYPNVVTSDGVLEAGRVQAWVCGPGLGQDERAAAQLRGVLAAPVPACVDADGISLLRDGSMAGLLRGRAAPLVLTPHDREFAKLAGYAPGPDRVESALALAAKVNAVILLKGDRTVVATPSGLATVNPTGTAALATAGSGDVLSGLIGSLLAAGVPAADAAVAAAYLHGLAGRLAAADGPVSAGDIAAALRTAVHSTLCGGA